MNLSKSNFKIAQSCATKLYYTKNQYPTTLINNEYMEMLAEGGYMVGKLAQLLYPDGIEVKTASGTGYAIKETEELLAKHTNIILFEAAISVNNKIVRVDILKKTGNDFEIIEVKSKSIDSRLNEKNKPNRSLADSEYKEYLEDVAFQKIVLQERFPKSKISSFLLVPDKAFVSNLEGILTWFKLTRHEAQAGSTFKSIEVEFNGNGENLKALHNPENRLLELKQVDAIIEPWIPSLQLKITQYIHNMLENTKIETQLTCVCRDCEFRMKGEETKNGFKECWGDLANPVPHILDLGQLGNVNKREDIINLLISQGRTSLYDVPIEAVSKPDGSPFYNNRPLYQLSKDEEFLLPGLNEELLEKNLRYPLHFIDFETSQMALPFHSGMRCYDNVIFQWSCHTVPYKGATPIHKEWINTESIYPNIEFARELRACIGDKGSVLIWSKYENTQLKAILRTMLENEHEDAELMQWLRSMIIEDKHDPLNRMIDMHDLAKNYYFHPLMGGRTSIKVALPSVLQSTKSAKIKKWLKDMELLSCDEKGIIQNPYDLLPEPTIFLDGEKIKVKDGSGAMRAYQDMVFGLNRDNQEVKDKYKAALLKYCQLDTLAMVIIWEHWMDLVNE